MKETDEQGKWEVTKGANCNVRLLVEPSQSFLDWQVSNPVYESEPARNILLEIDVLTAKVAKLEKP